MILTSQRRRLPAGIVNESCAEKRRRRKVAGTEAEPTSTTQSVEGIKEKEGK